MKNFGTIAIVGTGLIGGSLGLAVKRQRLARKVIGISRTAESVRLALTLGAIDEGGRDLSKLANADLVILCLPVGEILRQAKNIRDAVPAGCVVCDVGSTKEEITRALTGLIPGFVGSHPLAGSEKRGVANASAGLFRGALCVITRTGRTDPNAFRTVKSFWGEICSRTAVMPPREHDRILAFISHLPHAAAFALANAAPDDCVKYAASGFRDTTRLAASDPGIWRDIFLSNRKRLLPALEALETNIGKIKKAVRNGDGRALEHIFAAANKRRLQLAKTA